MACFPSKSDMTIISRIFILIVLPLLLIGCKEKQSYSYYMRHPLELKNEITECQSILEKTKEQAAKCEIIMYAAMNITALVNQQQQDPEKFGQRILEAQENYAKFKLTEKQARTGLDELKNKNASPAELRTAQDDFYKAKKASVDQLQEIKVMLAVVGLGSPE